MDLSIKGLEARRKVAQREYNYVQPMLLEAYEYAIPYRRGVQFTGKGDKRTNRIFDHTAIVSCFRTASRLAQDIWPAGQDAFDLTLGPAALLQLDDGQQKEMQSQLQTYKLRIGAHFLTGEWNNSLAEMCADLMMGTGAMLIVPDQKRQIARFVSVPIEEVWLTSNGYNDVNGICWTRKWSLQSIADEFGVEKFDDNLNLILKEKPETEFELYQDTYYNAQEMLWHRVAWIKHTAKNGDNGLELERSDSITCPWLTPRFYKVPGETYGRGPITMVMPSVKALNTGKRLTLQAAAIALMGIFTVIDDGVFNPDNAPIGPGEMWKVARNGGVLGPSIQRLPDPRLDLSQMIFKDMGLDIQTGIGDQQLPPDSAAVKSATEIMERVKRMAGDYGGAYGRFVQEIIDPVVRRVMEICYNLKQLPGMIPIDKLNVDIKVSSPLAMAREADKMQKILQYVQACLQLLQAKQQGLDRYAVTDVIAMMIARTFGVPENMVTSEDARQAQDQQKVQQQAMAMAAQNPDAVEAAAKGAAAGAAQGQSGGGGDQPMQVAA